MRLGTKTRRITICSHVLLVHWEVNIQCGLSGVTRSICQFSLVHVKSIYVENLTVYLIPWNVFNTYVINVCIFFHCWSQVVDAQNIATCLIKALFYDYVMVWLMIYCPFLECFLNTNRRRYFKYTIAWTIHSCVHKG